MKNLLFYIFILTLLFSCGKHKTVKITAKNPVTGVPYAGLAYQVVSSRTTSNGEKYRTEAEGTLDANGEAIVEIKQKTGRSYSVSVQEPPNLCYNKQSEQYFDSPYDQNGTFIFEFAECAYLKLKISNINCQGPTDNFKLYYMGRQVGGQDGLVGALAKNEDGCFFYEGTDFSDVPMGGTFYKWEVTKNGITNVFYDTIYLNAGEYKTYNIDY